MVTGQTKKDRIRCFVAAPAQVDLTTVRGALSELGVEAVVASEHAAVGRSIVEHVSSLISDCDYFLCVLMEPRRAPNVLIELGIAVGHKKRVLVLVTDASDRSLDLK